jgi:hypothetical protein
MSEQFVYPQHRLYEPYRELARSAELKVNDYDTPGHDGRTQDVRYTWVPVTVELAYARDLPYMKPKHLERVEKDIEERTTYFWHRGGGVNTISESKRWPEDFTNEGYRLHRRDTNTWGDDSPHANELIAFGVGLMRPLKPRAKAFDAALARYVGEEAIAGRADSSLVERGMTHIVTIDAHNGTEWTHAPFALETTNLIMPEVLGELQQLLERIDDTAFLEAYLYDLLKTCTPVEIDLSNLLPKRDDEPSRVVVPPSLGYSMKHSWRTAHMGHIGQGIWDTPPTTVRELRNRINYLIDAIIIDAPKTPEAA